MCLFVVQEKIWGSAQNVTFFTKLPNLLYYLYCEAGYHTGTEIFLCKYRIVHLIVPYYILQLIQGLCEKNETISKITTVGLKGLILCKWDPFALL
jgi:hypothetical protein